MTRALLFAGAAAAALLLSAPVRAQAVLAFVNGDPITSYDVEQRSRLNGVTGRRGQSRKAVLQELVDDRLKIIEARRIGYRIGESDIDGQVSRMARQNNQTLYEFQQRLAKAGIDLNAYRNKLRADYSWELAVSNKTRGAVGGSNAEIDAIYQKKLKDGSAKVTDYVLQSVVFVVSGNAGSRQREAAAARAKFTDCTTGLEAMRDIRDVAVKTPVKRASSQLSPQLNALLAKTPVNRLSPPFPSDQGIEMIAVCEKSERVDYAAARSQAEEEVANKLRASSTDDYLKSLRSKALIQYR